MPDLIAQGSQEGDRWRRAVPLGSGFVVGRAAGPWSARWDSQISRQHVHAHWDGNRLELTRLPNSRNPVFYRGGAERHFFIEIGEHFVIGNTTFSLADDKVELTLELPHPNSQRTYSTRFLRQLTFRQADQPRLDVLATLPDLIAGASSDADLFSRLVNVLLAGIPSATGSAIVCWKRPEETASGVDDTTPRPVEILHWDRRRNQRELFSPSERLIQQAMAGGETVLHVWEGVERDPFTQAGNVDWAFCIPVATTATPDWAVYVAGRFPTKPADSSSREAEGESKGGAARRSDATVERAGETACDTELLQDDVKFAEVASTTVSNLRKVRRLERNHASLSQFFSPLVLEALAEQDPAVALAPREVDVSVLFCDLRGFSQSTEREAEDLLGQLDRVSRALGVMTRRILDQGGVIGDFHGDAAMGFWGWPIAQNDSAIRACRAALAIRSAFLEASAQADHPLAEFQVGIGIASGRAVAGKLGSIDQVKVTVFGPVVNLSARLEGMTKSLRAPILLDEVTARQVRDRDRREEMRVRRVARVRPYGLQAALEVSELLPGAEEYPELTDQHIVCYEKALDALSARDWESAFQFLHEVPAEDRVKDFLTVYIAQHNRTPPENWDGAIALTSK